MTTSNGTAEEAAEKVRKTNLSSAEADSDL